MKKYLAFFIIGILLTVAGFVAGSSLSGDSTTDYLNPLAWKEEPEAVKIYEPFTIENLRTYNFQARRIVIEKELQDFPNFTSYQFTFDPLGRKMTGQLNIPKDIGPNPKAIVLVRGWAPSETYYTGMGTKNAAAVFAQNGYITIAPDFFGYGESSPEPPDNWLARFEKPIVIIELMESLRKNGAPLNIEATSPAQIGNIGIWAHSNGGQITLTALEISGEPIPSTLWAPVTAPFPYSVIFFSNEYEDEGKSFRKDVAVFEEMYNVFDYSLTQHLNLLNAPFQLHHGQRDDAAPYWWSDSFVDKVKSENTRRTSLKEELETATSEAVLSPEVQAVAAEQILEPIRFNYYLYPNADHNLVPSWNTAIQRDLEFFAKEL